MLWAVVAPAQSIDIYFSPNGGAATAVAKEITAAKTSIRVIAYSIGKGQITAALIAAQARGIDVRLIVDPHQVNQTYSTAGKIKKAGVPTLVDQAHALQHNKVIIIDNTVTITGSMNFTTPGDKTNAENVLIIRDTTIAARYTANWIVHQNHSQTFTQEKSIDTKRKTPPPELVLPQKDAHAQEP